MVLGVCVSCHNTKRRSGLSGDSDFLYHVTSLFPFSSWRRIYSFFEYISKLIYPLYPTYTGVESMMLELRRISSQPSTSTTNNTILNVVLNDFTIINATASTSSDLKIKLMELYGGF